MKVEYVDHMGSDLSVVNAARVSMDKVSDWDNHASNQNGKPTLSTDDTRLIRYLAKHNHWTPFAHTAITLRMSAPVPIRTQCFKHKSGFTENEESRRYIASTPVVFVPDELRSAPDGSIKQGSGGVHYNSAYWGMAYDHLTTKCIAQYEDMIADNVAPEQARLILPQGCMVNWIWTGNLASYARFYNQRTDLHAQKEIQDLAKMVGDVIGGLYPVAWKELTA